MTADEIPQRAAADYRIPTLPRVVVQLTELIDNPLAGMCDVGALIARDPPLAGHVLRIANSAYYGLRERCNSIEYAAAVLGLRTLRHIVTHAAVISEFEHLKGCGFDLEELWSHAVLTARTCARLVQRSRTIPNNRTDELYVSGLLHDIGHVVLLDNLKDEYVALARKAREQRIPIHELETAELPVTHADVGAMVATAWNLPPLMVSAVRFHHTLAGSPSPTSLLVAHVNLLVDRAMQPDLPIGVELFDAATLATLGMTQQAVNDAVGYLEEMIASGDTR